MAERCDNSRSLPKKKRARHGFRYQMELNFDTIYLMLENSGLCICLISLYEDVTSCSGIFTGNTDAIVMNSCSCVN